jgi:selenocysteine lyase/cysteine desulfurase
LTTQRSNTCRPPRPAGTPAYKVRPAHDRFETGTQSFESIAGAGAAIDYLASVGERFGAWPNAQPGESARRACLRAGMTAIRTHEAALFGRLLDGLERIPGLRIWGITDRARLGERTPTVAVTVDAIGPREAAEALGRRGITTWDGNFYAQALIERLGLAESGGVLRLGIVHYNTVDEIDRLVEALEEIAAGVRRS